MRNEKCLQKKIEILVIRTDEKGSLKNSKPCTHCLDTLRLFNVKCIYYSNDEGQIVKERLNEVDQDRLSGGQKNLYKFYKRQGIKVSDKLSSTIIQKNDGINSYKYPEKKSPRKFTT